MTLSDEAKQLRMEVARLRPGRGRKYTPALRRRIVAWVERAKESGMLETDCSHALGVPQHRFEMWREYQERDTKKAEAGTPKESLALVPVEASPAIHITAGLTFVSPRGTRVEGLTLEQAFVLVREFE
jgi:transposase-like protein